MKCSECGRKIRKNQTVCPWCAASQPEAPAKKKEKQPAETEPAQVRLGAQGAEKKGRFTKKQERWIKGICIALAAILLLGLLAGGGAYLYIKLLLGKVQYEEKLDPNSLAINSDLPEQTKVQNIALFGLDTRSNDNSGRSDAIVILTLDYVNNKIKLTSIARDTYVAIEGRKDDKLTHAWAYGKGELAVKTLNQNFALNITDYVYLNFYEFVDLIDYIGGVMVDVDANELKVMNNYYGPELRRLGFKYTNATTGYVRLNGAQALAYSRNRYTGSDIDRGNRQKEVLEAMFAQVKDIPLTKYPSVISQVLSRCHTTLTENELMDIARWAVTSKPTFEQFGLPTAACKPKSGKDAYVNGVWYFIYDLDIATDLLHQFIYEDGAAQLGTTSVRRPSTSSAVVSTTTTTTSSMTTTTTQPPNTDTPPDNPEENVPPTTPENPPDESDPSESNPDDTNESTDDTTTTTTPSDTTE